MKKQFYVSIAGLLLVGNLWAQTDMNAHNKKYDYRGEIKMPTMASNIQKYK